MPFKLISLVVVFVLLLAVQTAFAANVKCKGHQNQDVDWFFAHKGPGQGKWAYRDAATAVAYTDYSLANDGGARAVRETIRAIMAAQNKVVYNDQSAVKSQNKGNAHEKGFLGWGAVNENGAYLIHSTPQWIGDADIPSHDNGQSYMCITIAHGTVATVLTALLNAQVMVRAGCSVNAAGEGTGHPSGIAQANSLCTAAFTPPPQFGVSDIKTAGNVDFKLFYKGSTKQTVGAFAPGYNREIWTGVAMSLGGCMAVSTWHNMEASCGSGQYTVQKTAVKDVKGINIPNIFVDAGAAGQNRHDHSKFGLVFEGGKPKYFCVSGNNREKSQFIRGGLVLCTVDDALNDYYRPTLTFDNACDRGAQAPAEACDLDAEEEEQEGAPPNKKARVSFKALFGNRLAPLNP